MKGAASFKIDGSESSSSRGTRGLSASASEAELDGMVFQTLDDGMGFRHRCQDPNKSYLKKKTKNRKKSPAELQIAAELGAGRQRQNHRR